MDFLDYFDNKKVIIMVIALIVYAFFSINMSFSKNKVPIEKSPVSFRPVIQKKKKVIKQPKGTYTLDEHIQKKYNDDTNKTDILSNMVEDKLHPEREIDTAMIRKVTNEIETGCNSDDYMSKFSSFEKY